MNNIEIIVDEKIIEFVEERIEENTINLNEKIDEIIKYLLEKHNLNMSKVSACISKATKEEIRLLNKEYRNIDKATDVLSFPIFEKEELEKLSKEKNTDKIIKEIELGDIVLCMEVVEKQAIEYGTGLIRETLYMITHGMCHLLGYDHVEESQKEVMRDLEKEVLNKVGVK